MRGLADRSVRSRRRLFLAEGPQAVREAVAAHAERRGVISDLWVGPGARDRHADILDAAMAAGVVARTVSDPVLDAAAGTVSPQGLLAVCRFIDVPLPLVTATGPQLVAVLASVRDPGNAGTVLRAADAAGADAVVLTSASVDVYNAKCVRASAGSIFHVPVVAGPTLGDTLSALRDAGLALLAADGAGPADLDDLVDDAEHGRGPLAGPTAWVFGNEAWGLPEADRKLADLVVRVPVHGKAESLNLAAAATVCLYASARALRPR